MCLLNKTKSFGFKKKKKSDMFLRTRKIGFWFVLKKNQIYFVTKNKKRKKKFCRKA